MWKKKVRPFGRTAIVYVEKIGSRTVIEHVDRGSC